MKNYEITEKLQNLVGCRYKDIKHLEREINKLFVGTGLSVDSIYKTTCDILCNDNLIDLVFNHDENEFFEIWYLYDNAKKIYVTEI